MKTKSIRKSDLARAAMLAVLIAMGGVTACTTAPAHSQPVTDVPASSAHPSTIVEGLTLLAPFVYQETSHDHQLFSTLEVYAVPRESLPPLEAVDHVLSSILNLGFSNEGEEHETEEGSADHMNSVQFYLSGEGKRVQLLVGWVESGFETWDANIYVMLGEYHQAAA